MKTVNLAELKNRLSTYIRYVRHAPSDAVRSLAGELLDSYPLRAPTACNWPLLSSGTGNAPAGRAFLSSDQRLLSAAAAVGFAIVALG